MQHELGFGLGFGIADWPLLLVAVILSPFVALDVIGIVIGGGFWGSRLLFALFRVPWRKVAKGMAPVVIEIYRIWSALVWMRRIDRLLGNRRDRR
jgi:hypothetical protein